MYYGKEHFNLRGRSSASTEDGSLLWILQGWKLLFTLSRDEAHSKLYTFQKEILKYAIEAFDRDLGYNYWMWKWTAGESLGLKTVMLKRHRSYFIIGLAQNQTPNMVLVGFLCYRSEESIAFQPLIMSFTYYSVASSCPGINNINTLIKVICK